MIRLFMAGCRIHLIDLDTVRRRGKLAGNDNQASRSVDLIAFYSRLFGPCRGSTVEIYRLLESGNIAKWPLYPPSASGVHAHRNRHASNAVHNRIHELVFIHVRLVLVACKAPKASFPFLALSFFLLILPLRSYKSARTRRPLLLRLLRLLQPCAPSLPFLPLMLQHDPPSKL